MFEDTQEAMAVGLTAGDLGSLNDHMAVDLGSLDDPMAVDLAADGLEVAVETPADDWQRDDAAGSPEDRIAQDGRHVSAAIAAANAMGAVNDPEAMTIHLPDPDNSFKLTTLRLYVPLLCLCCATGTDFLVYMQQP